jgi:hypothetical protein
MSDVWSYREISDLGTDIAQADIVGFDIEAIDGSIGSIDDATYAAGASYIIVDTGPWIFGKKVMLPAGVVRGIDDEERKVYVNRTKEQIKEAPEYDDALANDEAYRTRLGSYYGVGGLGFRDWDDTL